MMFAPSLIGIGAGVVAVLLVYHSIKQSGRVEGAQTERARVEKAESKIDAKAKTARRAAQSKPADSVLAKYYRD